MSRLRSTPVFLQPSATLRPSKPWEEGLCTAAHTPQRSLSYPWQGQVGRHSDPYPQRRPYRQGRGCTRFWQAGMSTRDDSGTVLILLQDTHVDRPGRTLIRETLDDANVRFSVSLQLPGPADITVPRGSGPARLYPRREL